MQSKSPPLPAPPMCSSSGFASLCSEDRNHFARRSSQKSRQSPDWAADQPENISHVRERASRHQFSCFHPPPTKAEPTMALRHLGNSLSAVTAVLKMSCAASCWSQGLGFFLLISSDYCQGAACAIVSYGDGFRSSVQKIRQNAVNKYEATIFLEFTTGNFLTETIFRRG